MTSDFWHTGFLVHMGQNTTITDVKSIVPIFADQWH